MVRAVLHVAAPGPEGPSGPSLVRSVPTVPKPDPLDELIARYEGMHITEGVDCTGNLFEGRMLGHVPVYVAKSRTV